MTDYLPESWTLAPLRDLGAWVGGGTPSKSQPLYWQRGVIPWVSPKDMKADHIHDATDHITEAAVQNSPVRVISPRSVLVVTRSGILSHTLPVAIAEVAVTVNQDLKVLMPADGVSADYAAHALRAFARPILETCGKHGTTVHNINTNLLLQFKVPLAPPREQLRIAEALDSYLSRLNETVAGLERVQRNLKRYRASVLQAAVEGRLATTEAELARAEGRDYEPASELLARILTERRRRWEGSELEKLKAKGKPPKDDRWKKKYTEPPRPDPANLPDLPEGWCWAPLGWCAERVTKGTTPTSLGFEYKEQGIPFVRVENLSDGRIDRTSITVFIDSETDEALSRSRLQAEDVLFSIAGTIGRTAIVHADNVPSNTNQALAIIRGSAAVLIPEYLRTVLESGSTQLSARSRTRGGAMGNVSLVDVREVVVPVPPIDEQRRIVLELQRLQSVASATQKQVEAENCRLSQLRAGVLRWAFEGKLVDQDPSDEPAAALLERIRREREATRDTSKREREPRRRVTGSDTPPSKPRRGARRKR